ncbi:fungal-specific transcription factor domain-containing protein [Aspergillus avenaceus]|uniref:Fungal-specific transcription factor domain-containing protein n=1 Tax=Aspergillus avenaceus TaxID=36643 RepID=A0A5N6TZ07_ASPAV|nr:fungal-specific transcription factor domain-containing protein [Aspergillus avenaceus]
MAPNVNMNQSEKPSKPGNYRKPRRGPAYLRTKTGCLTCRRRKKKCDETTTTCRNCARRWLSCEWPAIKHSSQGSQRPTRILETSSRLNHDEDDSTEEDSRVDRTLTVTANILGEIGIDSEVQLYASTIPCFNPYDNTISINSQSPSYSTLVPRCSPVIASTNGPLFTFMQTVFLPQLIRPTAHDTVIEAATRDSLTLAFHTPFYMHALLACCSAEIPVDNVHSRAYYHNLARSHYIKAIEGLREILDRGNWNPQDTAIPRTTLMLCIYERSKPHLSRGVDAHILGLAQLIQLLFRQNMSYASAEDMYSRVILEAFIFHATTSIPFQRTTKHPELVEAALSLAQEALHGTYVWKAPGHPESPVLGVHPKLFLYIREITLLHERFLKGYSDLPRCLQLRDLIDLWDSNAVGGHPDWYHSLENQAIDVNTLGSSSNSNLQLSLSVGPQLYIIVAKALIGRMINAVSSTHDDTFQRLVREGVDLVRQLKPSTDYYAEYYCWPILVLGSYTTEEEDRACLLRQAQEFWKATRNGTMQRLVGMLASAGNPNISPRCRL